MRFTGVAVVLGLLVASPSALGVNLKLFPDAPLPYAVHLPLAPSHPQGPFPTLLFLHGNGSRDGTLGISNMASMVTWDGIGWALAQYDGNKTGAQQMYAEQYLTILPWLGAGEFGWDPAQVLGVLKSVSADFSVDPNRIHVSGYSLGAFGAWDTAFASPETFASIVPSGGGQDFSIDQLSLLAKATPPVSAYVLAASKDEKEPVDRIEANFKSLQSLNAQTSANLTLEIYEGTHLIMSRDPFIETGIWHFIMSQSKAGRTLPPSSVPELNTSSASSSRESISTSAVPAAGTSSIPPSPIAVVSKTGGVPRGPRIMWW